MSTPNITIAPALTTVGQGLFDGASSAGLVQGTAFPDASTRWRLRGGILDAVETLPMWGGVGVYEFVPGGSGNPNYQLGPQMGRATAATGTYSLAGFSVFDQAYGMVNSPGSPVPLAGTGGQVMMYPLGSLARIALACDPAVAALVRGTNVATGLVSWDYVNQRLIPHVASINVSSGTYDSTSGLVTLVLASAPGLSVGDSVTVAGLTGSGSFASANGVFTTAAGTTGTTLTYTIATGLTLTISTTGTVTTGAALAISILDVQTTNCQTVSYNTTTGLATWNYNGSCAVVQI